MWGIAELTLRKIKEPAFQIIFLLAIVAGFILTDSGKFTESAVESSGLIGQIMASRQGYPILTSTFSAIIFTLIMALFTGASDIPRDIDSRMIMLLLSKPVRRFEYLAGKFLGLLILCLIIFTATEITVFTTYYFSTNELYPWGLMAKQFSLVLVLVPFLAMMVMISCFVADVSAMILGVIYVLFSISMSTIPIIVAMLPKTTTEGLESYLFLFYYIFPNFLYYFQTLTFSFGLVPISLFIYSISMTVIFLMIGSIRLNTRDLI